MAERIACCNPDCAHFILPITAQKNDGYCMPCVHEAARIARQEEIRRGRRDVNAFEGVDDPVEILKIYHAPRKYDAMVNWIPYSRPVREVYEALSDKDFGKLVDHIVMLGGEDPSGEVSDFCMGLLAYSSRDLSGLVEKLVDVNCFYPSEVFAHATSQTAAPLRHRQSKPRREE